MAVELRDVALILPGHRVGTGSVTIAGDAIAALEEYPVRSPTRVVLPGLVNCHGHTAMTLLRGQGGGLPLKRWLEEAIFPIEAKLTAADISLGMTWGALEMLAGGTTCVADMYDFPQAGGAALSAAGMKGNICRVGLAFAADNPPGRLAECIQFVKDWPNGRVVADICVHSEYLTNEPFCRALAAANRTLKRPIHVHVSETAEEHRACLARHGKTPLAYLADTGLLDYGGYAAHCVHCTDEDFAIMREKNVTLVHNPSSNMKLGSGFARIPEALEAGVNVALGTDGCASNDNLNMFEEMHLAALIHKGRLGNPTVLPAWTILDMATKNGARALGRPDTGELAVGKKADLCVLSLEKPHLKPYADLANLLVYSAQAADVVQTYVDGRLLYDRGVWPAVPVEPIRAAVEAWRVRA